MDGDFFPDWEQSEHQHRGSGGAGLGLSPGNPFLDESDDAADEEEEDEEWGDNPFTSLSRPTRLSASFGRSPSLWPGGASPGSSRPSSIGTTPAGSRQPSAIDFSVDLSSLPDSTV